MDAGMAWGYNIEQTILLQNGAVTDPIPLNDKSLDFKIGQSQIAYYDAVQGQLVDSPVTGNETYAFNYVDGDVLVGAGFGLRTIVFGLPLRWDLAWPYGRSGFIKDPIHYFSIGIDF